MKQRNFVFVKVTFLNRRVKGETKTSQEDDETKSTKSLDSPAFKSLLKVI